jgi:formylglycine-generating enzyme required for sulfatase activity
MTSAMSTAKIQPCELPASGQLRMTNTFAISGACLIAIWTAAAQGGDVLPEIASAPAAIEVVRVPAGRFMMGCSEGDAQCTPDEHPAHSVNVKAFSLAKHEVTVAEFRRFTEATGYVTTAEGDGKGCWSGGAPGVSPHEWVVVPGRSWRNPGFPQSDMDPAVCITFDDASAFAHWLSKATGRRYRLPSEEEWEYAVRARTRTIRPWGDGPDGACAFGNVHDLTSKRQNDAAWEHQHHDCDDGFRYTAPVGSYPANAFGILDLVGNVWEWTSSCWSETYSEPDKACAKHVFRGGSWFNSPKFVRASKRYADDGTDPAFSVGFRLAEDP